MLFLIANSLDDEARTVDSFASSMGQLLESLDGFFVEEAKAARRLLMRFNFDRLRDKPMISCDKDTTDFTEHLLHLKRGERWGLISACGLPCIADPGSALVRLARKEGFGVEATVGPSSIFIALMLSGFYSQQFTFAGYFPKQIDRSIRKKGLFIYIERPYHNKQTLDALFEVLEPEDEVCLAIGLMTPSQHVVTEKVKWLRIHADSLPLKKNPAVFLINIL
ncbi:MAG: hypothetical protein A3F09_02755 [Chlamydiae bacterium RIFCSPHIGHO2_12_FULL_49_11]|nr:MAG: hypothetical protein A3F09_02755 [Chlamydiae bacterium RIFCSPHIGHO2_12_FULL_49_11]